MAKSTAKSSFWQNIARKVGPQGWKEAREAEGGAGGMIPDIRGVACLTSIKEDADDDGPTVAIRAKVVTPAEHEGAPLYETHRLSDKGRRTVQMALEMLIADLKSMGADGIDEMNAATELAEVIEYLNNTPTYFSFHTYQNGDYVNLSIDEPVEYNSGEEVEVAEDDGPDEESEADEPGDGDLVVVNDPAEDEEWTGTISGEAYEADDGTWYVAVVDPEGNEYEVQWDHVSFADSEEPEEGEESEEGEEEYELVPEKGDVLDYGGSIVEVTSVNGTKGTCNCKDTETGELYKGVEFSELAETE